MISQSRSSRQLLAIVLAALCLAGTAAALRDDQLGAEAGTASGSRMQLPARRLAGGRRRLLQPWDLGIPAATRRSGNVGNTGERRTNGLSFAVAGGLDTGRLINNTIRARTSTAGETTNMDFGGAGKTTYTAEGQTTNTTSHTKTGVDVRSIGAVGPGITASRAIDSSSSLAAKRLKPAGPPRNASTLERYQGVNDNVKAGAWEVLGSGAQDYAFAGDYDYSIITSIVDKRAFIGDTNIYDYDYGQPRLIPETGAVTTRTQTNLDNPRGRAAGFGSNVQATTAPNAVARGSVITSGIWGNNAARYNDDLFGTAPVFIPPNQFRQAGASAAGVGLAKTYKGSQRPGIAVNRMNAGTTVSRNYIAGGASDQTNYAAGTQAVSVRSQNVALTGEENIDFDAGRRRLLRATTHRH